MTYGDSERKGDKSRLSEMRSRYGLSRDYWDSKYDLAVDDVKFVAVPGHQWDDHLKRMRDKRRCYEFPKLRMLAQQIINEQKQTRPQGKVRGVEESDRALADLMTGICRNIEGTSNAELAYDIAYEQSVRGGLGFWRITTDYASQDDFELDIRIKMVRDFSSVRLDPAAVEPDRRDANFAFVEDSMSQAEFERRFPDADVNGYMGSEDCDKFREAGRVKVLEYWWKQPVKRDLVRLNDGRSLFVDEIPGGEESLAMQGLAIVQRRSVDGHKVMTALTNGYEFLTDPVEFPSKFIPIVPCWGFLDMVDGEEYFAGVVRFNRDSQRLHNVHKTAAIEAVAKAPKAPFLTKLSWIKGFEKFWKSANSEDYPYLPIAEDADGMPQRAQQAELPAALLQLAALDNEDMRSQTGQYAANLGAPSNESSGRAIGLRRAQGATATYNFIDGLAQAIRFTYEILVDMIPRVYDTPRVVRVLGDDGGAKWKQLYQEVTDPETGQLVVLNDISRGKYDVTVTVGPSYATQRMEAVDAFTQLAAQIGAAAPGLAPLLAYQVVKNLDMPGSEEIDKALRKGLVSQGLLEPNEEEGEQPPPPQGPPPEVLIQQAEMELKGRELQIKEAETQIKVRELEIETAKAEAEIIKTQAETAAIVETHNLDAAQAAANYEAAMMAAQTAEAAQMALAQQTAMSAQAVEEMRQAFAQLAAQTTAPKAINIVRGPDGRIIGGEVGGRQINIARAPDGRIVGGEIA